LNLSTIKLVHELVVTKKGVLAICFTDEIVMIGGNCDRSHCCSSPLLLI
jgi:hypothetical protein